MESYVHTAQGLMSKHFHLKKFHIGFRIQTNQNTEKVDSSLACVKKCVENETALGNTDKMQHIRGEKTYESELEKDDSFL